MLDFSETAKAAPPHSLKTGDPTFIAEVCQTSFSRQDMSQFGEPMANQEEKPW
jgi:hypothetical protein